jgi:MFS family permease
VPAPLTPSTSTPLTVLRRYRDFRLLFIAQLVMFGGDWFVMIPLLGLLQKLTGASLLGSLTLAADTGLNALLLPYAGTVADRLDRRKILVAANAAALVSVLLLFAVLSPGIAWLGPVAVGAVAVAKAFYSPAASAATPNLVEPEDLSAAMAVSGSAWGTMTVVGASIGGVLAAAFSPYTCFALTALGLVVAGSLALLVRTPLQLPREQHEHPRALDAIREALGYIGKHPRVQALVTVKSAVGLGNGVLAIYPLLAVLTHAGQLGTGLLFAVRGLGAMVGPLLLRRWLRKPHRLVWGLAGAMAAYGIGYLGISLVHWFPVVLLLILVAHTAGGGNWAMSSVALQAQVPDELRGRVVSADFTIASLAVALSQVVIGLLLGHVDPWLLIGACGAVTLSYAIGWRLVTLRTLGAPVGVATATS